MEGRTLRCASAFVLIHFSTAWPIVSGRLLSQRSLSWSSMKAWSAASASTRYLVFVDRCRVSPSDVHLMNQLPLPFVFRQSRGPCPYRRWAVIAPRLLG